MNQTVESFIRRKQCIVPNCESHKQNENKVSLHRFPNDNQLRQNWIDAITTPYWVPNLTEGCKICSVHFESKYKKRINQKIYLAGDAIPMTIDVNQEEGEFILGD